MAYERRDTAGAAVPTTLSADLNADDVSIPIADPSGWPLGTNGKFIVAIGEDEATEEKLLAQSRSGSTLSLASNSDRGIEGTNPQGWSSGTRVRHVMGQTDADEANYTVAQTVGAVQEKGDLLIGTSLNNLARHAVGANGAVLVADSSTPTGWAVRTLDATSLGGGLAGNGLVLAGSNLNVNPDNVTVGIQSDALFVRDGGVTAAKLASDAVTTAKIAAGAVVATKIPDDTITTTKIQDASISTAKIVDGNVTAGKLADNAVTTAKLTDANVTDAKIATGITATKIGAVIGCCAVLTTPQTLTTAIFEKVAFNQADAWDNGNLHNPASNATRVTITTGQAGRYRVDVNILIEANATGFRRIQLIVNNTVTYPLFTSAGAEGSWPWAWTGSFPLLLGYLQTDYVELQAFQNSGANLDVQEARLALTRESA